MVNLKFCYQNEIHKCSNIPQDYATLLETIETIFKNNLNSSSFELQYEDSDGDNIMLSNQDDYEAMLESESKNPNSIKIFITNKGDNQIFQLREDENEMDNTDHQKQDPIQQLSQVENYQVIDKKPQEELKADDVEFIIEKPKEIKLEPLQVIKEIQINEYSPQIINSEQFSKKQDQFIPFIKLEPDMQPINKQDTQAIKEKDIQAIKEQDIQAVKEQDVQAVKEQSSQETQTQVNKTNEFLIQTDISMSELNDSFMKRPSAAIHKDVVCKGCGETPIIGIRYKCSVCDQFNFCEICEQTIDHMHSFIKIKNPSQEYGASSGCGFKDKLNFISNQYKNLKKTALEQTGEISGFVKNIIGIKPNQEESKEPAKKYSNNNQNFSQYASNEGLYDAMIIEYANNIPKALFTDDKVSKRIKIRNTGLLNFPENIYIRELNNESNHKINLPELEVNKKQEETIKIPVKKQIGKHVEYWVIGFINENDIEEFIGKPFELTYMVVKPSISALNKLTHLKEVFPDKETEELLDIIQDSEKSTIEEIIEDLLYKY